MAELDETELYKKAHELKGLSNQLDVALEEAAELIQILVKYRRGVEKKDKYDIEVIKEKIAEELADNEIMANQLKVSFGKEFSNQVDNFKKDKLNRLKTRLGLIMEENKNEK